MDLLQLTKESADAVIAKSKKRISDRLAMAEAKVDEFLEACNKMKEDESVAEEQIPAEAEPESEGLLGDLKKRNDALKRLYSGEAKEEEEVEVEEPEDEDEKEEEEVKESKEEAKEEPVQENEYQAFFQQMLKQKGVSSPTQLPPNDRKEFFKKVKAGWAAKQK